MTDTQRTGDQLQPEDVRYQDALGFLYDRINYERMASGTSRYPFRLKRITELLRRLGLEGYLHADSPQPKVPLVHIAGTKGKGSTAAMVAAALTSANLRTGLYASPHLHRLEERFRVDGQEIYFITTEEDGVSVPIGEQAEQFIGFRLAPDVIVDAWEPGDSPTSLGYVWQD